MKSSIKILLAIGCAYAMAHASSSAQIFTFDENGNSSGPGISPGVVQPDPSGGLTVPVLVYNLAFPVVNGDLLLTNGYEGLSDIVRFWNPAGATTGQIIFYSDATAADPPHSLADTGLPQLMFPLAWAIEGGPEGNNGATYIAGPGMPGWDTSGVFPQVQYNIISDVPEPSVLALAGLGAGALLWKRARRFTARTR